MRATPTASCSDSVTIGGNLSAVDMSNKVPRPDSGRVKFAHLQRETLSPVPAYGTSKTSHNGKKWVSEIDGNVWEPGVYG